MEIWIRRAVSSDAAALARLRSVMFEAMQVHVGDRDSLWLAEAREWFTHRLATSDVAAFVAQTPDGRIVAAALSQVTRHAPSPANPSGVSGQLSNVVTDPEYRRLGLSRACVEQLLSWFRDLTDANDVGLFATDCGASLYESLGFGGRPNPAMSLNIRRAEVVDRGSALSPSRNRGLHGQRHHLSISSTAKTVLSTVGWQGPFPSP